MFRDYAVPGELLALGGLVSPFRRLFLIGLSKATQYVPHSSGILRRIRVVIVVKVDPGSLCSTCLDPVGPFHQLLF
jgi:hypothetical protein